MHIYDYEDKENPSLSDIETVTKIRDKPWMYPSVTTILKIIPNPFIETWRVKKAVELKGENPELEYDEINDLLWGKPICPATGEKIASSDFGTNAHDRVEKLVNAMKDSVFAEQDPYDDYARPVIDYFIENDIEPVEAEKLICCHKMKIAGRIDLVAKKDDRICLFDYKFRDCSSSGKGKFYDSDNYQLAIESFMVMKDMGLDYLPKTYSVCVCNTHGEVYVKEWSQKMIDRGISRAKCARDFYFGINDLTLHNT